MCEIANCLITSGTVWFWRSPSRSELHSYQGALTIYLSTLFQDRCIILMIHFGRWTCLYTDRKLIAQSNVILIEQIHFLEDNTFFQIEVVLCLFHFHVILSLNFFIRGYLQGICCIGVLDSGAINIDRICSDYFVCKIDLNCFSFICRLDNFIDCSF